MAVQPLACQTQLARLTQHSLWDLLSRRLSHQSEKATLFSSSSTTLYQLTTIPQVAMLMGAPAEIIAERPAPPHVESGVLCRPCSGSGKGAVGSSALIYGAETPDSSPIFRATRMGEKTFCRS